jgi:hypothetical protein
VNVIPEQDKTNKNLDESNPSLELEERGMAMEKVFNLTREMSLNVHFCEWKSNDEEESGVVWWCVLMN